MDTEPSSSPVLQVLALAFGVAALAGGVVALSPWALFGAAAGLGLASTLALRSGRSVVMSPTIKRQLSVMSPERRGKVERANSVMMGSLTALLAVVTAGFALWMASR